MKSKLILACLLGLSFGISAMPAQSFDISFGRYDHNHDGRWDRHEYYNACKDYHCYHHHAYRDYYRGYGRYDRDHSGYLSPGEVRAIRTW